MPPTPPVSASGNARKLVALAGDAKSGDGFGEDERFESAGDDANEDVFGESLGRTIGTNFFVVADCAASLAASSEKFTTACAAATPGTPSISVGGSLAGGPARSQSVAAINPRVTRGLEAKLIMRKVRLIARKNAWNRNLLQLFLPMTRQQGAVGHGSGTGSFRLHSTEKSFISRRCPASLQRL